MDKVTDNPFKTGRQDRRLDSHTALMIVTALFVTLYLVSNIMAVKVIGLFDLFFFDAAVVPDHPGRSSEK